MNGLEEIANTCKELQELRVFPSDPFAPGPNVSMTEQGLVAVSMGCLKLQSVLYFCRQMTNDALVTIAKNRPNMIRFHFCIIEPRTPDYLTLEPLNAGFGGIVQHCKELQRLSLSGLLTDRLHYVLSGCESLRKLEIRDCPFGDDARLANSAKLETMRSLWMSNCSVSFEACKLIAQKLLGLNVEVIDKRGHPDTRPESCPVENLYIYRTVSGMRFDTPGFVWIIVLYQ
ncbi:hypothetical protein KY290_027048 [Solanum tuberosum]|uniref:Transport inhibitor response 1 n=1 Tax=Solanum tuberosum TaxID=4113 RepID=A0ABQ7UFL8_SOLTU|nr:hypothetical protein KY284_026008 [Solanum tuberosum]KAH0747816.1 hypothetical protein KY290_027048 [Solanum tuberosum]